MRGRATGPALLPLTPSSACPPLVSFKSALSAASRPVKELKNASSSGSHGPPNPARHPWLVLCQGAGARVFLKGVGGVGGGAVGVPPAGDPDRDWEGGYPGKWGAV